MEAAKVTTSWCHEIKLTHKHFELIAFDRVQRFDDAILLAAKIKVLPRNLNLVGAHTATLEGRISKKMLHQVTGHAGQQLMADTAKYYGVNVAGVVTKCLSCSLEKIRQKNIPKIRRQDVPRYIINKG